jgi:putative RNA 2'-phosphotransferase
LENVTPARKTRRIHLSKLMSLVLRHDPDSFGVALDAEGYAALDELVTALRTRIPDLVLDDILEVVETLEPDKRRFTIIDREIRANYGHSIADRIVHPPCAPPEVLWHGTTQRALPEIRVQGLLPMQRQYVHMTDDRTLARRIGSRRGIPHILQVDAARAFADGIPFYRANASFWLADALPAGYLSFSASGD